MKSMFLLFSVLFAALIAGWVYTDNVYLAIATGVVGVIYSLTLILNPSLAPSTGKMLFPKSANPEVTNNGQRVFGAALLILSMLALLNYRIKAPRNAAIVCVVLFTGLLIQNLIYLRAGKDELTSGERSAAIMRVVFGSVVSIAAIVVLVWRS
jgi:hypothetical protein